MKIMCEEEAVSRQAVIDALRKLREEDIEDYGCEIPEGFNQDHLDRATFAIKQLPVVYPDVVHCKDCRFSENFIQDDDGEKWCNHYGERKQLTDYCSYGKAAKND